MRESYPYYLAGRAESPNADLVVTDKYSGQPATRVAQADEKVIDQAIAAAVRAAHRTGRTGDRRRARERRRGSIRHRPGPGAAHGAVP